jgi:hypothetical protein
MDVQGVRLYTLVQFLKMPDCPASNESDTGMKKNSDAGTSPVPQLGDPVRHGNVFRYRIQTSDTVMPMPMPSYDKEKTYRLMPLHFSLDNIFKGKNSMFN